MVLALSLWAMSPAGALDYRLAEGGRADCPASCPPIIVASGEIEPEEGERFLAFLVRARAGGPVLRRVMLDSLGGFLDGGLALGQAFRTSGVAVTIGRPGPGGMLPGHCASACVLALAGGVERSVVAGSRVGVHRAHPGPALADAAGGAPIREMRDDQALLEARARHYQALGVDPALASLTHATPNSEIRWLTPAEISRFRLAVMR